LYKITAELLVHTPMQFKPLNTLNFPSGDKFLVSAFATSRSVVSRVGEEECADSDDDIHHNAQYAFQVVGLAVAKKGANYEHSKHKSNSVEDGKVVVHVNVQTPANQNDEGCVEQRSLDGRAHNVCHGHVDLVVVGFIDGEEMFWNTSQ
jgi:hypothetical protein